MHHLQVPVRLATCKCRLQLARFLVKALQSRVTLEFYDAKAGGPIKEVSTRPEKQLCITKICQAVFKNENCFAMESCTVYSKKLWTTLTDDTVFA
mmetsp:Transcript_10396/g.17145  ORF Transcript_10396/g.17145 Transcript_10396/m.17145 type:complete len:95 (-) Transcript_10396:3534-3818(-)